MYLSALSQQFSCFLRLQSVTMCVYCSMYAADTKDTGFTLDRFPNKASMNEGVMTCFRYRWQASVRTSRCLHRSREICEGIIQL